MCHSHHPYRLQMNSFSFFTVSKLVLIIFQCMCILFLLLFLFFFRAGNMHIPGPNFIPRENDLMLLSPDVSITKIADPHSTVRLAIKQVNLQYPITRGGLPWYLLAVVLTLMLGIVFFCLEQLKRMIKSLESGNPFNRANAIRIFTLSGVMGMIPLFQYGINYGIKYWIERNFAFTGVELIIEDPDYLISTLGFLFLAMIGFIFQMGIELRKEQELTV